MAISGAFAAIILLAVNNLESNATGAGFFVNFWPHFNKVINLLFDSTLHGLNKDESIVFNYSINKDVIYYSTLLKVLSVC